MKQKFSKHWIKGNKGQWTLNEVNPVTTPTYCHENVSRLWRWYTDGVWRILWVEETELRDWRDQSRQNLQNRMPEKGELHRENPEDMRSSDHCIHGRRLSRLGENYPRGWKGGAPGFLTGLVSHRRNSSSIGHWVEYLGRSCLSNGRELLLEWTLL